MNNLSEGSPLEIWEVGELKRKQVPGHCEKEHYFCTKKQATQFWHN